ncbi:efflux RND transporter periplasmic adaptor subunit [Bradyrhizobium sp. BRP22]|uniref:efflux RND transporter periplasmic adaptor subunit n=1 Tax=Bradyrhizobium sp. BRP22 TaxID=2793821 RepID=UPI001CD2345E|nr:efflux RND transporter periplasmic adaptor subunit [Bradyrhizobium sp. BRP22]MCA1458965.1 efflux RND transporter periplasmic adaptor subunit [Bradyrhizobium sp. BRP22]
MARRLDMFCLWLSLQVALFVAACGGEQSSEAPAAQSGVSSSVITVLKVKPEAVTFVDELPGRVAAYRTAEIRPQVGGIIEKRLFDQGSEVEAGQILFQINPDPFKAEVDSAAAVLQRAESGLIRSESKFDRAKQLVTSNAISRDAYDDALANLAQAKANVVEAQATLQRRRLDLAFTTVRAPIAGRIGQALVTEGALVSANGTKALAIVQQIDRVYVDIRRPAAQIDVIREATQSGQLDYASKIPIEIIATSGKPYPVTGRALFSDINVDPGTGNVTLRVEMQNSERFLLPGMYVRARVPRGVRHNALLVPQEAVIRDSAGRAQVIIVDHNKQSARRLINLGEIVAGRYIVTSGLKAGDTVVVQGHERVQDGGTVHSRPFTQDAAVQAGH